ncbi:MAG: serine/threonine-protein kinase, partial [Proteobacteria bacterium]|nr:serine/threonine-protein kinase [Pseudomonadota bacterium]
MPDSKPVIGSFSDGRFEIRGQLGAGGAGIVYRAYDRQVGREVALKHLRQASGRDLFRFKREFRSLANLEHPNLIVLHELHASGDSWFFTMELVEGVSFIDWVRPGILDGAPRSRHDIVTSRLDVARLRAALIQLIDAILALHEGKTLHRDLKPSNVMVDDRGRVTLLDFGLIAGLAEGEPERLAVGTPVYMSPEQAADQPLDEASDWYSLGAMLYEALVGRRPFEGSAEQVMTRKQTELPPSPAQLVPDAPLDLTQLAMALLAPQPRARPRGVAILDVLGAAPSARTRDMARSLAPAMFVGRARELDELRAALAHARRRGTAILVRGRSGLGKSTLVRRFSRELGTGDAGDTGKVMWLEGRCFEREAVPFKMLDGLVDSLTAAILKLPVEEPGAVAPKELGSLCRLFPVLRRVPHFAELAAQHPPPADPQELRRRGFQALR